jgi:hypothetical protein
MRTIRCVAYACIWACHLVDCTLYQGKEYSANVVLTFFPREALVRMQAMAVLYPLPYLSLNAQIPPYRVSSTAVERLERLRLLRLIPCVSPSQQPPKRPKSQCRDA